jgi:aspartokinase-like uncharacterized kinase
MTHRTSPVHTILKIGGGLLAKAGALDLVVEAVTAFRPGRQLVVIPGGGPFADVVRRMFNRIKIGEDAAHWMAVLGMEQYAHALAARITGAALVDDAAGITRALAAGELPVLAPYRWLRETDPLPHTWEITSDSIAAWFAGALGARRVVLIKAVGRDERTLVDSYFFRTLPQGVEHLVVTADDLGQLEIALDEGGHGRAGRRADQGPERGHVGS